jgi:hypothetical protein
MPACPCCVTDEHKRQLFSKPLRELAPEDLQRFASDSLWTWGTLHDFKHFLPRIFEIFATHPTWLLDIETIASKLPYSDFNEWPPHEREAVRAAFMTLLPHWVERHPHDIHWQADDIISWLRAVGLVWDDLAPWLDHLEESTPELLFAAILENTLQEFTSKKGFEFSYWRERPEQNKQVERWFLDPARDDDFNHLMRSYDEEGLIRYHAHVEQFISFREYYRTLTE